MKSGEADVQSLTNNAALTTVARARLSHLVNEGVIFGIGISRKDNKDVVFVAVNAQASDPNSPDLASIHRRLKDALQDIQFEILGGYDNVSRSDNPPSLTEMPKAALLKVVPQHESPSNAVDEVTLGTTSPALKKESTLAGASSTPVSATKAGSHEISDNPIGPGIAASRPRSRSLIVILSLAALSGWGAFGYREFAAQQQERASREEMSRALADRDRLGVELNQVRAEAERNQQALERAQAELVDARASREEMSRAIADRDKLNTELNRVRAEAERNRLALERVQGELVKARAQSQTPQPEATSPERPTAPRSPIPQARGRIR